MAAGASATASTSSATLAAPSEGFDGVALTEAQHNLRALHADDPAFDASAQLVFERPAYELPRDHPLPRALETALISRRGAAPVVGMSFWTDAAIMGRAGVPSVLFGPTGAGLHSVEEYVEIDSVLTCREVLADLAFAFGSG